VRVREVVVLLAVALVVTGCGRAGGEDFQPTHNGVVALTGDVTVGQTLNPAGDRLAGVDLQVATYAQAPDAEGTLRVTVRDADTRSALAVAEVDGEDLADLRWTPVRFDPPVTVDDVVLVEASWEGGTPLALLANIPEETRPRNAEVLLNDPYAEGTLVVDGRPEPGDLVFRVRGTAGPAGGLAQVAEVAASAGSRLLAEPAFAVIWLLGLLGGLVLAVRGLRRRAS